MFWTNHGLTKNEKSSVHLSSCGKNSEKNVAHEPCKQDEEKLLHNSTSFVRESDTPATILLLPKFRGGLLNWTCFNFLFINQAIFFRTGHFQFNLISSLTLIIKLRANHQLLFINLASVSRGGNSITSLLQTLNVVIHNQKKLS